MKENIKILTQNCTEDLLAFSSRPNQRAKYNEEIFDVSSLEFVKIPTKIFIDKTLVLGTSPKDDCQSSIAIFKELKNLDKVQANDKRLWTCLTHTIFFNYTRTRWSIDSASTDNTIISRFHFEGTGVEARMRNSISRLWWTAKVTYDENRADQFELTKLIWEKQDLHVALMERSFGTYSNIVHGVLEFSNINKHLVGNDWKRLLRGLNAIGGVKMLPSLTKEDVVDEIKRIASYEKILFN